MYFKQLKPNQQAYDQRDEAEAKIQMLREKNEKDLATYNYEYRELMRIIDHDAKLKSFINVKAMERNDTMERKDDMTNKKTGRLINIWILIVSHNEYWTTKAFKDKKYKEVYRKLLQKWSSFQKMIQMSLWNVS